MVHLCVRGQVIEGVGHNSLLSLMRAVLVVRIDVAVVGFLDNFAVPGNKPAEQRCAVGNLALIWSISLVVVAGVALCATRVGSQSDQRLP